MGAKTVYLHNRIWKQQQQPRPRCEHTSRFLEALTSNNPPGHPESKTRQPPRIQTFKRSAFDLPTYLPYEEPQGKEELRVDEKKSFFFFFFFARSNNPTRRHNYLRLRQRRVLPAALLPFCGHLIPKREKTPCRLTDESSCLAKKLPVSAEYFFFFCGQRILGLMYLPTYLRLGKWDEMGWNEMGWDGMI